MTQISAKPRKMSAAITRSYGVLYTAPSDGIVFTYCSGSHSGGYVYGQLNGATVTANGSGYCDFRQGVCFPVAKGDTYKILKSGGADTPTIYFKGID